MGTTQIRIDHWHTESLPLLSLHSDQNQFESERFPVFTIQNLVVLRIPFNL